MADPFAKWATAPGASPAAVDPFARWSPPPMVEEPVSRASGPSRFVSGALDMLNPMPALRAVADFASHPLDSIASIPSGISSMQQARQEWENRARGRSMAEIGATAAQEATTSDPWDVAGRLTGAFVAPGVVLKGAQKATQAVKAAKGAKLGAQAELDLITAIPQTKTAPYSLKDWEKAKPYLNQAHSEAPITSTVAMRDALDTAITNVESHIGEIVQSYPTARVNVDVGKAVGAALKDHPRVDFLPQALKELDDLKVGGEMALPEIDSLRRQLNAENKAVLKRNNYDVATARKVDAGFAAREIAAKELRDGLYDYLETRGVQGVRELRQDEGSLIKLRNATERQAFTGQRPVRGQEPGVGRKVAANVVKAGSTATGAYVGGPAGAIAGATAGEELATLLKGGRKTRDDLIARLFSVADDRRPTFPGRPADPIIRGELPPASIELGPAPDASYARGVPGQPAVSERLALPPARAVRVTPQTDTSGPIEPTLPEPYARHVASEKALAEFVGPDGPDLGLPAMGADAATERSFFMRWLADDLREMGFQKGGSTKGQRRAAYEDWRAGDPEHLKSGFVPAPHVAGTPTLEMFKALGMRGSRADIASRINAVVSGKIKNPKIEAVADAFRQAWDGERFDWQLVSDSTIAKLGIRRNELKSPISLPNMDDMPSLAEQVVKR